MSNEDVDISVEQERKEPMVSVKVERKLNLGDYENASVQVFMSSGTLDEFDVGDAINEEGEINEDLTSKLQELGDELAQRARNNIINELKAHNDIDIVVKNR